MTVSISSMTVLTLVLAAPGQTASITVIFSTRAELRKVVPSAACFVVPGATSLADYQARRGSRIVSVSR